MKKKEFKNLVMSVVITLFSVLLGYSQDFKKNSKLKSVTVEASCGQCQFGMKGNGCDLAIRINGASYFVTGTGIDDHGDAHAHDGFCSAIRKAVVTGEVKNDKFEATEFKLIEIKIDQK